MTFLVLDPTRLPGLDARAGDHLVVHADGVDLVRSFSHAEALRFVTTDAVLPVSPAGDELARAPSSSPATPAPTPAALDAPRLRMVR